MGEEKAAPSSSSQDLTLEIVRDALIRQEDSIVFALIERARFPYNAPDYDPSYFPKLEGRSLVEAYVREAEALQAKKTNALRFGSAVKELLDGKIKLALKSIKDRMT